jgi:hypothetical protein
VGEADEIDRAITLVYPPSFFVNVADKGLSLPVRCPNFGS